MNLDLADADFWAQAPDIRNRAFAELRQKDQPIWVPEKTSLGRSTGHYAVLRHDQVTEVSRNPSVFSSEPGVTTPQPNRLSTFVFGQALVNMDNPRHGQLRGIVQKAFTPRNMNVISERIDDIAREAVDELLEQQSGDFLVAAAAKVPFQVIADMMGVPDSKRALIRERIFQTTDRATADHAFKRIRLPGRGTLAMAEMQALVVQMTRHYRKHPADNLMTALVTSEKDGKRLTFRDLGAFFNLLLVAGIETSRNAMTHFLHLMTINPDQRELLMSDFDTHIDGAIEEVLRCEPSIFQFRRHVTQEHRLGSRQLHPGDQVAIYFNSANRDETVFTDPDRFDITRSPNPQVGFGAGGPHMCLGKLVARREMSSLFRELYTRAPSARSETDPVHLPSNFDNRFASLAYTV